MLGRGAVASRYFPCAMTGAGVTLIRVPAGLASAAAGAKDDGKQVLSLDAKTGQLRWSANLDDRVYDNKWGNGPRGTPTIDGDRAYALSANGPSAASPSKTATSYGRPIL